jgi:hypothetical protein
VNAEPSADDRFYEWLLSDHPGAAGERARRRLDHQLAEADDLARLRAWLAKIDGLADSGQPLGDSVWRLAEQTRTRLIPGAQQRLAELADQPDQVRVRRWRRELEISQRVKGNHSYRYPARYLGPDAARQPIPPDPWTQPHDPEERPSLGERAGKALEKENSPSEVVRTLAVTERAQAALERAHRQRPIQQAHNGRQPTRPSRIRGDREEAERER